jgi:hypothetical protein
LVQIKGFYRGATPSFVGAMMESAILFGSYSQLKTFLQVRFLTPHQMSSTGTVVNS